MDLPHVGDPVAGPDLLLAVPTEPPHLAKLSPQLVCKMPGCVMPVQLRPADGPGPGDDGAVDSVVIVGDALHHLHWGNIRQFCFFRLLLILYNFPI